MSMNTEGDYKVSKYLSAHRGASLALVLIFASFFGIRFGFGQAVRASAAFCLPLGLIWFAEQLSVWALRDSGGWLSARNADGAVQFFGWLALLLLLGMRAMVYFTAGR
jgi:hypothetical protein